MSLPHAIDGDDALFEFDYFEGSPGGALDMHFLAHHVAASSSHQLIQVPHRSHNSPSPLPDCILSQSSQYINEHNPANPDPLYTDSGKGKGVSQPVDILPRSQSQFDMFSFFPSTSAEVASPSSASSHPTLASFTFSAAGGSEFHYPDGSPASSYQADPNSPEHSFIGSGDDPIPNDKGKGRATEFPPCLPPLSFSQNGFAMGETNWPERQSPLLAESPMVVDTEHEEFLTGGESPASDASLSRVPTRQRSSSSLSAHSARSLAAKSMSKLRTQLGKVKNTRSLAKRLLKRKSVDVKMIVDPNVSLSTGSLNQEWLQFPISVTEVKSLNPIVDFGVGVASVTHTSPTSSRFINQSNLLAHKGRSQSTPIFFPVPIADIVSSSPVQCSQQQNLIPPPCYFDTLLPKELKLNVFRELVSLHESEHENYVETPFWTATKAASSKMRWVGRDKGIVVLVRLSRVSKTWQRLVLDGQLWSGILLSSFPNVPPNLLLRLTASAGQFTRRLDLRGHSKLTENVLSDVTMSICGVSRADGHGLSTRLTQISLAGCYSLTTTSLHKLVLNSPMLRKLEVKGLNAVTNSTCAILSAHCPRLENLDVSRCHNMDSDGVMCLASPLPLGSRSICPLRVLRLSGLKRIRDEVLGNLGRSLPLLEVLDLSGARELHNSALDAFIACDEDEDYPVTVTLQARDLGRDNSDKKLRRRVTRLRHLSLSACPLLTDIACSNLVHSVPDLEFLELAGIGSELKDDGLIRLLETTPSIRRLDLEEACEITDDVLVTLTPRDNGTRIPSKRPEPQPGAMLEQLVLSYASNISNQAVSDLIKNCTNLRTLDVDNTNVSGDVVREFIHLSRARHMPNAAVVAIDCRGFNEGVVKEVAGLTRTRHGWRSWESRHLKYLDARDNENLGVGQDECDEHRVTLKTFYSWQTVDAVEAARERAKKSGKRPTLQKNEGGSSRGSRWWTPGARRSGSSSPLIGVQAERDGCTIM